MELHYWYEKRVCAKKRKGVSIIKEREGRDVQVYIGTIKKRVHKTFKVASNNINVFYEKEEWKEAYGTKL